MFRDQHGWNKERERKVERVEIKEIMVVHGRAPWLVWVACRCIRQGSPDVYICYYICIIYYYLYYYVIKRIMRNWLTQLWRLRCPMTCYLQAGDPGSQWCNSSLRAGRLETQKELMFQSEP